MQEASIHCQKIAAISNPLSGRNKRGGFTKFVNLIQEYPTITHFVVSKKNEILNVLAVCKQKNIQIIIVNGGDGTLQLILTFLLKDEQQDYSPKIVLLRAGTTSMNYGDVGCRGSHKSILNKLMQSEKSGVTDFKQVDRVSIRMTLGKDKSSICGMFFGAGAIHSGILYCRQNLHTKGMRGELGPSMAMIRFLFDWVMSGSLVKPVKAIIYLDNNQQLEGVFSVLVGTSLHRLLMGAFPFWGKKSSENSFGFTAIKQNAPGPLPTFFKILRGHAPQVNNHSNYYYSLNMTAVKMKIYDGFTLDGELFGQEGQCTEVTMQATKPLTYLV